MRGILADANIRLQVDRLATALAAEPYKEFWDDLGLAYYTFEDIGLVHSSPDSEVWHACQRNQLVLLTDNRNKEEDSLENVILAHNTLESLPVLTISNMRRFRDDGEYADRVLDRLAVILVSIATYRGAGRVYLP